MITYKYKLYNNDRTKHIDKMLREACFVWNHALSLQKRYYSLYGKFIKVNDLKKHFTKRIKRNILHSQTTQEIIERLDISYQRFFKHIASRPPKYKKATDFTTIVYKQGGYTLNGNVITLNSIKKRFKFSYSRPYEGNIKRVSIKRSASNEYYVILVTDSNSKKCGKTHNGASVGIDFGLKTYMTLSNGIEYKHPQYLKQQLTELRRKSRNLSKSKKGSNNREKKRLELCRLHDRIHNLRNDYQWRVAHELCRNYDYIFLEDLTLKGMTKLWGRKMSDLAHAEFVNKLEYVASKYDVVVHKIDRWYASSKTCECGQVNKNLKLTDREWVCTECGCVNHRDLLASNNILRKGISELQSESKTTSVASHVRMQESHSL